jgi:hypothetical protein
MMRGRSRFRQRDVIRAIRATVAGGLAVERVEVDDNGKISLLIKDATMRAIELNSTETVAADGRRKKRT